MYVVNKDGQVLPGVIRAEFETIGPVEAEKMLRRVYPRQVGRNYVRTIKLYARQMLDRTWDEEVAQPISISDSGELIDGWHRLNAVIMANLFVRFLVVRGVSRDAFAKYDSGRPRSLAFRAGIHKDVASIGSLLVRMCYEGKYADAVTPEQLETALDFIAPQLEVFNALTTSVKRRKLTASPVRVGCLLRMKEHDVFSEEIARNYARLQGGDLGEAPRVIRVLYRRLLEENNAVHLTIALSYIAFDPDRWDLTKIQITDVGTIMSGIRGGVLKPLKDAIA